MKISLLFAVLVCLLALFAGTTKSAYLITDRGLFCIWRTKRNCDYTTPICVQNANSNICRYYANDCQRQIDACFRKSASAASGTVVVTAMCNGFSFGTISTCM